LIDIADPLQMNGYSYAKNSPISTSDPDGLRPITLCEMGCSDGDDTYRDWMTPNGDGTWSYHYETTHYVYDGEGAVHSTVKRGSDRPPLGKKTVYKPYNLAPQKTIFSGVVSLFLPDFSSWGDCFSGSGVESCALASTDLPLLKALKLVPDSVIKKGVDAVEEWLSKRPKGCKCFLAGTDVLMADGTTKDIEDVALGDKVLATDPETGESGPRKVTRLIVTEEDKHFNELSIATEDGIEKLTATHEHPFWSPSALLWVEARDLKPGMTLLTDGGDTVVITGNRAFTKHARTYNLTVDDLHTYYVLAGQTPVLVHNSGAGPDPTSFSNLIPEDTPEWFKPIAPGTVLSRSGNYAYVVTSDGELVIGKRTAGHVSLAQGRDVLAAGEFKTKGGQVVYLDNKSGHYQPYGAHAQKAAVDAFNRNGLGADGKYIEAWRPSC
jgi:hypothetical protein